MRSQSTKFDITIESVVSLPIDVFNRSQQVSAGGGMLPVCCHGWYCGPVVLWHSSPALLTILATFSRYAAPCPAYTLSTPHYTGYHTYNIAGQQGKKRHIICIL